MKRLNAFTLALLLISSLWPTVTVAQSAPPKMGYHTVYGRLGAAPGDTGPGQAIPFATLATQLAQISVPFLRTRLTTNTTFYVNGNNAGTANCNGQTCQPGSDSNNGLTTAAPFLTMQAALNAVINNYDYAGFLPTIQLSDAASSSAAAANYSGVCIGNDGSVVQGITIQGNTTSPTNVHITAPNGGVAIQANDFCTLFLIDAQIDDAGAASGALFAVEFSIIDVEGVTLGSFNSSANVVHANKYGIINFKTIPSTIAGGGAATFALAEYGGIVQASGTTIAIPSAVAFTAFAQGTHGARFRGFSSGTFTGSGVAATTGVRANLSTGASLNSTAGCNSTFPGNSPCGISPAASDDANDPPTAPAIAGTTTFGALPTPIAGMYAYITDGKASNCGDSACTTFGTAVTGGTGALPLFIWYTGAAWHLVGK